MRIAAFTGFFISCAMFFMSIAQVMAVGVMWNWIVMDIAWLTILPLSAIFFLVHMCKEY
jgi:hypothetical protein